LYNEKKLVGFQLFRESFDKILLDEAIGLGAKFIAGINKDLIGRYTRGIYKNIKLQISFFFFILLRRRHL